jgi:hypothetical protein
MIRRADSQKERYYRRLRAAHLSIGATTVFPLRNDGETVRECQGRVRALLSTWKETRLFRWSVRQGLDGVEVTKVGSWATPF